MFLILTRCQTQSQVNYSHYIFTYKPFYICNISTEYALATFRCSFFGNSLVKLNILFHYITNIFY